VRHIFRFKDGTTFVAEESLGSSIIVSSAEGEYPKLQAMEGLFAIRYSDERSVYFPFTDVVSVVSIIQDGTDDPFEEDES
jgi:hypothetical protein